VPCIYNTIRHDGGRSQDPDKLDKDIAILKAALEAEPNQSRYAYFLAESYFCKRDFQGAREAYERRSKMGSYKEEVHRSFYHLGKCNYLLQKHEEALSSYCKAYQFDPERIEPLYDLSLIFLNEGQPLLSYLVARFGVAQIGRLKPQLRSQPWIVDGGFEELLVKSAADLSKKYPFLP
jgi:tetratricopeptide (TPR) repeat protein